MGKTPTPNGKSVPVIIANSNSTNNTTAINLSVEKLFDKYKQASNSKSQSECQK